MSNYTRQHDFSNISKPTGQQFEDEFNAIQAILNGGLEITNIQDGEVNSGFLVYNAGAEEFQPNGTESDAARVENAIAAAVAAGADSVVVFVPQALWGYIASGDYVNTMYDDSVLLVREGQTGPWHDPVAYGAVVDGATDDYDAVNAAFSAAQAGSNVGAQAVAFTYPGDYNVDNGGSGLTRPADVALIEMPGVTISGTGISGEPTIHDAPKQFIGCHLGLSADEGLTASNTEELDFDDARFDKHGYYNATAGRVEIPSGLGGMYRIEAGVRIDNSSGSPADVQMELVGSIAGVFGNGIFRYGSVADGEVVTLRGVATIEVLEGEQVRVRVTSDQIATVIDSDVDTVLTLEWLGKT